jgi:hypothetical protein
MSKRADRERILAAIEAQGRLIARTRLALRKIEKAEENPPASNSMYWRPKSEKPQEDAPWLTDGWSGKR